MSLFTTAGMIALPFSITYIASCFPRVKGIHDWLYPIARWRNQNSDMVLTFDDGPDPEKTPRLLDVLDENQVKATFFVIGKKAAQFPNIVSRMAEAGHQIGNHTWSHPWLPGLSNQAIAAEVDRCQAVIEDITNQTPCYARPPYGQRDFRYHRCLQERNIELVLWSYNLRDYYRTKTKRLLKRLHKARTGDIILCHDGDPLAPNTVEAIPLWLESRPVLGLLNR